MKLSLLTTVTLKACCLLCFSISLFSCKSATETNEPVVQAQAAPAPPAEKQTIPEPEATVAVPIPEGLAHLYPMEVLMPESKNPFEKYGIEFSGVCYSCDLAEIKITAHTIDLINVCDAKNLSRIKDFSYRVAGNQFIAETKDQVFVFTKVEATLVYTLEIRGKDVSLKNKRLVKYYAPKKIIKKFEQHDCGDFQG